ncbi:MAG TPA: histidine kinase [Mycobacteriales bacterium]|jgi:signal transduction histidine kinase|nr:histidine kinase [Mycobacteriales bacterium]
MTDLGVQRLSRAAVALLVGTGAVLSDAPPLVVAACTAVALLAAALLPTTGWPALAGALTVAGGVAGLCGGSSSNLGWFALCVLGGWCGLWVGTRQALAFVAAATVLFVGESVSSPDPGWFAWIAGTVFGTVVCVMAGRQRELIRALSDAQAGLTERVRADERNRMARELHDVIAHSLTVSLLHVTSARLALEDDPAEAAEALARAEELGRQSLTEVRHAVGLLRDGPGGRSPLPGTGELPQLVDGFRKAGAQVAYDVVGDPSRLPATTGLTVYRILQESLTNAVRHGAGRPAVVRLEVDAARTVLTVDSAGAPGPAGGDGVGLHSMRERAEALGGELTAGPSGAGWRVHAVLPS